MKNLLLLLLVLLMTSCTTTGKLNEGPSAKTEVDYILANTDPDILHYALQERSIAQSRAIMVKSLTIATANGIKKSDERENFSLLALSMYDNFTQHPAMVSFLKHMREDGADYYAEINALPVSFWEKNSIYTRNLLGLVNHTGASIYLTSVDGREMGDVPAWQANTTREVSCIYPKVWHSGFWVRVKWNTSDSHTGVWKEKIVEIEKYDELGDVYLHFFPNDEVRVVVSKFDSLDPRHPIIYLTKPVGAASPE